MDPRAEELPPQLAEKLASEQRRRQEEDEHRRVNIRQKRQELLNEIEGEERQATERHASQNEEGPIPSLRLDTYVLVENGVAKRREVAMRAAANEMRRQAQERRASKNEEGEIPSLRMLVGNGLSKRREVATTAAYQMTKQTPAAVPCGS
jgi:hypothetical protein